MQTAESIQPAIQSSRPEVRCPTCRSKLFDGQVIKGVTVIRVWQSSAAEAKCKQCKEWVTVPLTYTAL